MNKKAFYTWLFLLTSLSGFSQLTNDWINYDNKYFKVKVYQDGIYRIDYAALLSLPLSAQVSTVPRKDFKIFGRGKELYIHIEASGSDNLPMASGDYIEFYGEKNTGWLDTAFYANPNWHANPNISLFTDTATYYLTWDNTPSLRISEENNVNYSGKTTEDYFMYESRRDYFSNDFGGVYTKISGFALYEPEYTEGQGWSGPAITSTYSISVPISNVYTSGPSATASTVVIGANLKSHLVNVSVAQASSQVSSADISVNKLSYTINTTNLVTPNTSFTFSPQAVYPDRNTVAFISIDYPHTLNLGNASAMHMDIPNTILGDTAYLDITNFNDQGQAVWLYDLTNNRRIVVNDNGSTHEILVPNSGGSKRCYLFSESEVTNLTFLDLQGVGINNDATFTDYSTKLHDSAYLIIYHKKLTSDGNGNNFVNDYANYRRGSSGGNHDVIDADIEELYDQFAYGIRKNPMAIRGFAEYTLTWPTKPKNLLLIGKGVSYNSSRSTSSYFNRVLVPTFGWPSSDVLLTAGLDSYLYAPAIPTGRIAASTALEVGEYLNKIQEFDANQIENVSNQLIETQEWKKQILHFAGGSGSEHTTFSNYVKGYESIIEDTLYGGKVHQFNKNSSDPIQITASDSIEGLINNGVSILTFFGHASGSGFDQNIDDPDVYQNIDGKYPLLIANSCLVGDIHQPGYSSNSEAWTLHPRGTIGFLASVSFGEPKELNIYTTELYQNIGQDMYGQTIGEAIQQTVRTVELQNNLKKTCLFMTLHGDPAVVLNTRSKPDYAIRTQDVYTTPSFVSTETDSFDMHIIVTNLGMAIKKEIGIEITRRFPAEALAPDTITVIAANNIFYKDTFTVRLPVDFINGMGLNNFEIRVDNMNIVEELSEYNNNIVFPLLIRTDDIIPIYPYEFAVVPDIVQSLRASTGNALAMDTIYRFQIDTSDAFDPPLLEDTFAQSGGVVEWVPSDGSPLKNFFENSGFADSTVFFWRVRRDSLNPSDSNHSWRESSYQFISGKRGWGQAHFHQFKKDDYNLIDYNKPARTFDFVTTPKELKCQTIGSAWGNTQWLGTEYRINGSIQIASSCFTPAAVLVAVIDPITLEPDVVTSPACGSSAKKAKIFWISDPVEQTDLVNYLTGVPVGHYILAYTFRYGLVQNWDPNLILTFQSLGWNSITTVANNRPFIYFVKKGDFSSVQEVIGTTDTSKIWLSANLASNSDFGTVTTQNIGPVQDWISLHWDMAKLESTDSVRLEVRGINSSGNTVVIPGLESLPPDSADIYNLGSLINPATYSNIKLRAYKADDSLKTAAQLRSWHVLMDDVPESALNPSIQLSFYNDTIDEGEIVSFSTVVQNVSEYNMDSLLISFWIVDKNRNVIYLPGIRYKPLLQYPDTILTGLTFSTKGLQGLNSLWIEVNPIVPPGTSYDQLEKYHFNNILEKPFFVTSDKMNPLVDVTFDGVHILDGDLVSAEPQITIELKDENKYLALDNDSIMRVYLTPEGQLVGQPIPYNGNTLVFIPASLPENRARVEFKPGTLKDGIYELKVQARDVSQNESGDLDYLITFEVVNKPTITSVMNWPNPFSTSTKFVFTLTGSETPQDFRIRILTITGRVVREIFADELGPLHIGKNITEYAWDGRDEFGDQLANGVYLYKVDIQLNDAAMELRETNADQFFHKGYGKMYLMR